MELIVGAQHQQKRWPNEEKWRHVIDKNASQMDGNGSTALVKVLT
jgi:hypothetical protein